jgi:hypothetical protein
MPRHAFVLPSANAADQVKLANEVAAEVKEVVPW